jgi:hypothetical protein
MYRMGLFIFYKLYMGDRNYNLKVRSHENYSNTKKVQNRKATTERKESSLPPSRISISDSENQVRVDIA